MKLELEKIENGWLVSFKEEIDSFDEARVFAKKKIAFEDKIGFESNSERESLVDAFNWIICHYDLGFRKHHSPDDRFIKISLVDGNKFWDDEEAVSGE